MTEFYNPDQTVLFPELFEDINLPPITSLPDFDNALENLVRLSDFGSFIQLHFQGIDKSFSLNLRELSIPKRFLLKGSDTSSPVYHIFPVAIRQNFNRLKYEVRSFFNKENSIKTPFGYFLFRRYFRKWDTHRIDVSKRIIEFLQKEVGGSDYQTYYKSAWNDGFKWLLSILKKKHPYTDYSDYPLEDISKEKERLTKAGATLYKLDRGEPEFLRHSMILKTLHIPCTLSDYVKGISVVSTFKTIHLEYLKNISIEGVEDIRNIFNSLWKSSE